MDLTITGFKNKQEIIEFMNWYSWNGEQDFSIWLENEIKEGKNVRKFIPCDFIDEINNILCLEE
jgi:hypothetical protein